MFRKLILISFLFLFSCTLAFADTFVVTSNADSGPGTLREALTNAAANGSAVKDFINFNLPVTSETGRTIIISTQLPDVSSNLVIDGSTQAGNKFGVSDAKVKIMAILNTTHPITSCFNISNQHDIEIYGLLLDSQNPGTTTTNGISGIYGVLVKNITIGAPGKGNIIKSIMGIRLDSNLDETNENISENVKVRSNILGLNEDGESLANDVAGSFSGFRIRNLSLGGLIPAEGNIFEGQVDISEESYTFNIGTGKLLISNNFFGANVNGTKPLPSFIGSTLSIDCYALAQAEISKNLFVASSDLGLSVNCFFTLKGNKFGTDITGIKTLGTFQFPLILSYCGNGGIVGGNDPDDQNIFSGAYKDNPDPNQAKGGVVINVGSPKVELLGNSFKCNYSTYPYQLQGADFSNFFVKINNRNTNSISGTATANSRIDLYYSLSCDNCEPEKLFKSVNSDNDGNWNYTGPLLNNNIIAAATLNGTTSEFTGLRFTNQSSDVKIKMACNNQNNGSIIGILATTPAIYTWLNESNTIVGHSSNLIDVPAGKYHLIVSDGYCSISSPVYEIKDGANQINATNRIIKPSSCNSQNGGIIGIEVDPTSLIKWTDQLGNIRGNYIDLMNVEAGSYRLSVSTPDGSCTQIYGPVTIPNTSGPNIDESTKIIQSTPCGQSTGSIISITVTGTNPKYSWKNEMGQEVATTKDLIGKPAGRYILTVTDDTPCGSVNSSPIEIPEVNGITLNESLSHKTDASCNKANGSVTGITASGATKFEWRNANNNIAGSNADLIDVPAGAYRLTASNNFGCSKTTQFYQVLELPGTAYPAYVVTPKNTCFGQANGSLTVTPGALVKSLRWVNASGQTITTNQQINGIAAGTYKLYFTDQNDCESLYGSYTINETPLLQIIPNTEQHTDDQCSLNTGSIKNIQVTGGEQPYTYKWYNANNQQIASTVALTGASAGSYKFEVDDASGCWSATANYTIAAQSAILQAPVAGNVQLCTPGDAFLTVSNTVPGNTYRLYESASSISPLAEQANGRFKVNVTTNTTFYISQASGSCESSRTGVQVAISLSAVNISNTITPNGDGINDYWRIDGMENYPNAMVQVFNRYGQKLFESKGYHQPFNGTFDGKALPNGAYYYVINLNKNCSLLSGSLTVIR